jgi:CTP synthase
LEGARREAKPPSTVAARSPLRLGARAGTQRPCPPARTAPPRLLRTAEMSSRISENADKMCKYVVVSGGVISGIGKGLTASSIGVLLKSCGWRVTAIKIDPYINIDAGTMSPIEHGEVFVLDDGGEADLDLGNYERFLGCTLQRDNNITTGKIYSQVIERERRGDYLGKTVQVIPHVTDAIQDWIHRVANTAGADGSSPEICVIELGGTVGDIESMPFVEALRQLRYNIGDKNFCSVFVSLVPELGPVGEQKTKPTQHGVKNLTSMGLSPQLIVCRSERPLLPETKRKIGLFCQVDPSAVVSVHDVSNTYKIPLMLQQQGVCNLLIRSLQLVWRLPTLLEKWANMATSVDESARQVTIAVVGKYTVLSDAYLSVDRALQHAGMAVRRRVNLQFVESSDLEEPAPPSPRPPTRVAGGSAGAPSSGSFATSAAANGPSGSPSNAAAQYEAAWEAVRAADGILVPGGFGQRGLEGKIAAVAHARETRKPFLGICLGMQAAAIQAVRTVFKEPRANSAEVDKDTPLQAVVFMPEGDKTKMGGTMRLGSRATKIVTKECLAAWLYGSSEVHERHRHRYEVNPDLVSRLDTDGGLQFVGMDETGQRMEIVEARDHPFFLGTQYHPEFKSRPGRPSPAFMGLIMAAAGLPLDKESVMETMRNIREQDPWAGDLDGEAPDVSGLHV